LVNFCCLVFTLYLFTRNFHLLAFLHQVLTVLSHSQKTGNTVTVIKRRYMMKCALYVFVITFIRYSLIIKKCALHHISTFYYCHCVSSLLTMRQNSEYLMKVITKTYSAHYISTFYYCHWVGAAVGGLLASGTLS
jgi:hypothetical protein